MWKSFRMSQFLLDKKAQKTNMDSPFEEASESSASHRDCRKSIIKRRKFTYMKMLDQTFCYVAPAR